LVDLEVLVETVSWAGDIHSPVGCSVGRGVTPSFFAFVDLGRSLVGDGEDGVPAVFFAVPAVFVSFSVLVDFLGASGVGVGWCVGGKKGTGRAVGDKENGDSIFIMLAGDIAPSSESFLPLPLALASTEFPFPLGSLP